MITISVNIDSPISNIWEKWTDEKHIVKWYFASDDWHCPTASNEFSVGGKFNNRMEAKDGSFGFDFEGVYTEIVHHELIKYVLGDDRKVEIYFRTQDGHSTVETRIEPESENPKEMQREGWLAILQNFKKYVEEGSK